jgi:type IV fimbrial biogenesis protein FimT
MSFNRHMPAAGKHLPRIQRGFTVVELMMTIAVAAILLGIAVPSFNNAILGYKLSAYANNLAAGAFLARSEAIKRNATVTMCASSDGASCTGGGWEQGWIVLAGTDVLQQHPAATNGFKLTGTVSSIIFQPTGVGATPGTITVCRATPEPGAQERLVAVSATGRPSISKTSVGACA